MGACVFPVKMSNHILTRVVYLWLHWLSTGAWWGLLSEFAAVCNHRDRLAGLTRIFIPTSSSHSKGLKAPRRRYNDLTINQANSLSTGITELSREARRQLLIFQVPLDWTIIKNTQRQYYSNPDPERTCQPFEFVTEVYKTLISSEQNNLFITIKVSGGVARFNLTPTASAYSPKSPDLYANNTSHIIHDYMALEKGENPT